MVMQSARNHSIGPNHGILVRMPGTVVVSGLANFRPRASLVTKDADSRFPSLT